MAMKRRFFLFAAPAIVAAPSLMRVSTAIQPVASYQWYAGYETLTLEPVVQRLDYLVVATLRNRTAQLAEIVTRNNAIFAHLTTGGILEKEAS